MLDSSSEKWLWFIQKIHFLETHTHFISCETYLILGLFSIVNFFFPVISFALIFYQAHKITSNHDKWSNTKK